MKYVSELKTWRSDCRTLLTSIHTVKLYSCFECTEESSCELYLQQQAQVCIVVHSVHTIMVLGPVHRIWTNGIWHLTSLYGYENYRMSCPFLSINFTTVSYSSCVMMHPLYQSLSYTLWTYFQGQNWLISSPHHQLPHLFATWMCSYLWGNMLTYLISIEQNAISCVEHLTWWGHSLHLLATKKGEKVNDIQLTIAFHLFFLGMVCYVNSLHNASRRDRCLSTILI
jgi:hypothetical protein